MEDRGDNPLYGRTGPFDRLITVRKKLFLNLVVCVSSFSAFCPMGEGLRRSGVFYLRQREVWMKLIVVKVVCVMGSAFCCSHWVVGAWNTLSEMVVEADAIVVFKRLSGS